MKKKILKFVGIDEAGRGPLAGPVAVGVVCVPADFDWKLIPGTGDSKKVSVKNREIIFHHTLELKKRGILNFSVSLIGAPTIDRIGITRSVSLGITRGLERLACDPETTYIKLDGLLKAPPTYTFQETIIRGDAQEKVIGLASILAKVTRDAYMVRAARKHSEYHFEVHKGYGTKIHIEAIKTKGLCPLHRRSFTRRFWMAQK